MFKHGQTIILPYVITYVITEENIDPKPQKCPICCTTWRLCMEGEEGLCKDPVVCPDVYRPAGNLMSLKFNVDVIINSRSCYQSRHNVYLSKKLPKNDG